MFNFRWAAIVLATLSLGAPTAGAVTVTYAFTGRIIPGTGLDHQTVIGSMTLDPELYDAHVSQKDGASELSYSLTPPPSRTFGKLDLSGGFTAELGGPRAQFITLQTVVDKGATDPVNSFELYMGSADSDNRIYVLDLFTSDNRPDPSFMFPGAAADDRSATQAVAFNTTESSNTGFFEALNSDGSVDQAARFDITSVQVAYDTSAVPEPGGNTLLLSGATVLMLAGRRSRRR